MSITSKSTTINEDGPEKNAFTITFTNGAKQQLEELKEFLKAKTELDVIKMGISLLQKLKENKLDGT